MLEAKKLPPLNVLNEKFIYDRETGKLYFRETDKEANSKHCEGYLRVGVGQWGSCLIHRIVYKMVTGREPKAVIDHLDGNRINNRFENLRESDTTLINAKNKKKFRNNPTGFTGVTMTPGGKFHASGRHKGILQHLGDYVNIEDAVAAREEWEEGKGFTRRHGK